VTGRQPEFKMRLAVNIDHIATLRQARHSHDPDPVAAAVLAELAGASGITVHLRTDRRHIQDRDLFLLRRAISTKLNIEIAVTDDMAQVACGIRPDQVTLVPERPGELTTEGGLDVAGHADPVAAFIDRMHTASISVSLFLDPDLAQIDTACALDADAIEINTGRYAESSGQDAVDQLQRIQAAAEHGASRGVEVLAGHGLNYHNVIPMATIRHIAEVNIGHSIVSRSSLVGIDQAVRDMLILLREGDQLPRR
jgi:pyridoxine 5-phosphate synthase